MSNPPALTSSSQLVSIITQEIRYYFPKKLVRAAAVFSTEIMGMDTV